MDHKASVNTSFLKLPSTIQGRNQGKETTQHQCLCNQKENGRKEIEVNRKQNNNNKKETQFVHSNERSQQIIDIK